MKNEMYGGRRGARIKRGKAKQKEVAEINHETRRKRTFGGKEKKKTRILLFSPKIKPQYLESASWKSAHNDYMRTST